MAGSGVAGADAATGAAWRSWSWACALAAALFVLDALVLGQGLVAALLLGLAVFWWLPLAVLLRRLGRPAGVPAWRGALCCVTAVAIMLCLNANGALARQRAGDLIDAIELYRAARGAYPRSLDALVPVFLEVVPRARLTLVYAGFTYAQAGAGAELGYFRVPPYRRAVYDFPQRRWRDETP